MRDLRRVFVLFMYASSFCILSLTISCGTDHNDPKRVFERYVFRAMPASVTQMVYHTVGAVDSRATIYFEISTNDLQYIINNERYLPIPQGLEENSIFREDVYPMFRASNCPAPTLDGGELYISERRSPQIRYLLINGSNVVYVWSLGS